MRGTVLVTPGVLTTTAHQIHDRPVREYLGIVSGDSVVVIRQASRHRHDCNFSLTRGRQHALSALARQASAQGGTVVVGVKIESVQLGPGIMLVTATGTAVRL